MAAKKRTKKPQQNPTQKVSSSTSPAPDEPTPSETSPSPLPNEPENSQRLDGIPVVGLGASAGGLDAFKKFFTAMPADSNVAFVLIPHLDPKHESLMVELISRHTRMPVVEAEDGMSVEVNRVYIIPPNKYMTISGGVLRLSGPVERGGPQTSIDLFLRSLAEDKQEQAICIILSGTGAHGTLGLKAVKAAGGMAMVQDPDTADYPAMPQSAIATELADFVLPVEKMPQALVAYLQHTYVNGGKAGAERKEAADELNQVLALLRAHTKLDFRHYRKKMLARRVERRMSLSHFDGMADYLTFLRDHPDELRHLSRDLLISVTSFFRDPEAWQALATQVIAPLVRAKEPDTPIRVWCAGCATGEEPYSLGMLLLEQLAAAQKSCPIQIFATDVDDAALDVARRAIYPESISADVAPERLTRFFTRVSESSYQVSKQLRETVIFARQNLISDAPFSKLDLVVCRNLLIYLEQDVQKKVITLLHFALNEAGWLFLGSAETIGRNIDLFEPISSKWRIYGRIGPSLANNVQFPVTQLEPRELKPAAPPGKPAAPSRLPELAQNFLLRRFALACVVINRNYDVLHFAGPTEDYLIQPGGAPTHDLLALARPGLDSKLRVVVQRAIRDNSAQSIKDVMMRHGNVSRRVNIDVEPLTLSKQTEGLLLIAFQEQPSKADETLAEAKTRTQTAESDLMRQLEQELETTREDLQGTIEELESSNEELKASNEEIMSMNEELQSANEELETSKEELQSLNEEYSTVNNQLHDKVGDLETANNDMANFLNCTDVATVFLDSKFRIRRFTPAATRLFNLIAGDVGRPIGDIVKRFADDELLKDAEQFLHDLKPRDKEVRLDDGAWCLRRIVSYRTLDNRIDGVVFTFVDITERKQVADAITYRLAAIVEGSSDAIISKDLDGIVRTWNLGAESLFGYAGQEAVGKSIQSLTVPNDREAEWAAMMERLRRGEHVALETERVCKNGHRIPVALTASPLRGRNGEMTGVSTIVRNISERKIAEQALRDREERLQTILNTAADAIITIDQHGIIQSVNPATERMFLYSAAELIGQNVKMLMPPPYREEHDGYLANYAKTGIGKIIGIGREVVALRKDGSTFPIDLAVSAVNHLNLYTGILRDITRRKDLEREVVEIASLEQQRIGQDLHDECGQQLTAIGLLADGLAKSLSGGESESIETAEKIEQGLRTVLRQIRSISRGLALAEVGPTELPVALNELTSRLGETSKVRCVFHGDAGIRIKDKLQATHLFHIAQEACNNAVKHARAQNVQIQLQFSDHAIVLRIVDDGIGIPENRPKGLGMRIMRNRASVIGANLTIEAARPRGTVVTCTLKELGYASEV